MLREDEAFDDLPPPIGADGADDVLPPVADPGDETEATWSSDLKAAKQLLWQKHDKTIGDNDPVLMVWTLLDDAGTRLEYRLQSQLTEILKASEQRIDKGLTDAGANLSAEISRILQSLKEETLRGSIRENLVQIADQVKYAESITGAFKTHRKFLWAMTAINGGLLFVAAIIAVVFFQLLK